MNPQDPLRGDANNDSIALRVSYGDVDFLFMGDAEQETEATLIPQWAGWLDVEVLRVGHHGSNTSSTAPFLDVVSPEIAVVSVGNNSYGHPAPETLDRLADAGARVYRTDRAGDVEIRANGTSYWVVGESKVLFLPVIAAGH